jgi:hypothetical protein
MDDRAVLLDLRRERYFGLDEVGSTLWAAVERGATPSGMIAELARVYDAPIDTLTADTHRFIAELQERGLLESRTVAAPRPPRLLTCFLLLALMDVFPRVFGLRRTLSLVRLLTGRRASRSDATLVAQTTQRLITAAVFYPRRALCLEQSLALVVLLRRRGVPAELKIGVQPLPFLAHAWVEVEGRAIEETQRLPLQLATFSALEV